MPESIPAIPKLHDIGRKSLEKDGERLPYGNVAKLAQASGLSEEWFRKARQLAVRFPNRKDLESILTFCEKHDYAFTRAHLLVMLPVPSARWKYWLTCAATPPLKKKWSLSKLKSMILRQQGLKNLKGGRHRGRPSTTQDAYLELQRFQRGWSGMMRSLKEEDGEELRDDLSRSVRKHLKSLDAEMTRLKELCEKRGPKRRRTGG
jgi:hypothetical protein